LPRAAPKATRCISQWVPAERILTTTLYFCELSSLPMPRWLIEKATLSSFNAINAFCEAAKLQKLAHLLLLSIRHLTGLTLCAIKGSSFIPGHNQCQASRKQQRLNYLPMPGYSLERQRWECCGLAQLDSACPKDSDLIPGRFLFQGQ